MSNYTSGLRFDVYERVHLPEDVAGIDELEEIELVPRIQIVQQGEQVLLKGHLLLSGLYRTQNERSESQSLEHWIPVEITLPLNRVNRLDDISVEIDNFDVDLLSARTLNITGVLSLLGIEVEQPRETESWREEPFTVVHRREPGEAEHLSAELEEEQDESPHEAVAGAEGYVIDPSQSFQETFAREYAQQVDAQRAADELEERQAEERRLEEQRELEAAYMLELAEQERREAYLIETAERERAQAAQREREAAELLERESAAYETMLREAAEQKSSSPEPAGVQAGQMQERNYEIDQLVNVIEASGQESSDANFDSAFQEAEQQAYGDISPIEAEPARKEMQVVLGSKPASDETAQPAAGVGFRSLLQSSKREQEARAVAEESAQRAAEEAKRSTGDEIEWKTLFLSRTSDDNSFRKVRICIVQREETLEHIAIRYHLQPRELALYNRLTDQNIAEGQVLYIP
ncbi:LysM peptidoglycan-binding domain-containing protein [Paenibacillus spongiae]|uniref:LysM peptidoglycan-binding domain-containing protein n=1 Tax=Paenibacillus spongiae TaxID=2909671 RepID=A0ABY5S5W2_9BACL|nr:LysM peptidoglycan-binding domain-containing protein [Paenibacillus spongiae]UVI28128.1 LysM peptidoglycan-binding domain-containing protein [Paenibacillus spongiae]